MKKIKNLCESDFLKVFFAFYTACFLIAAPLMPDRGEMFTGLWEHEMAKDEARHGKALKGLLERYFK